MSRQATIERDVSFSGISLQEGKKVEIICRPAPAGTGIVFIRTDIGPDARIPLNEKTISTGPDRRTTLSVPGAEVQTIEHFMSVLWCLSIDNIYVELNAEEMPAMDGSAGGFLEVLRPAGRKEQDRPRRIIEINKEFRVEKNGAYVAVYPAEGFVVSYSIDYGIPSIPSEKMEVELSPSVFEKEILPARTFCLKEEAEMLLKAGLGKGATFENTLVMAADGPVDTKLRFSNEPLRHKMLDLVGDLYLTGRPLKGRIEAVRSGHRLNAEMVRYLYREYNAQ
ncbi:MAG: UDP-3-O-acyl-N-acetylglucosamine deacetylase [Candidatus Omnitrophica bacterium]|nr:UDP-3-O-acyl-N-acetylglucosamine deacetylase [Candidatus Omnitrophota bacterium]MDD5488206.1 UDP-3-O-acyl-N-acetylglucosamine deacetylase [Candidatus Omnitrophota bacterium]